MGNISFVDRIYNESYLKRAKGYKYESYIYMIGCYAAKAAKGDIIRQYWHDMRQIFNAGLTVGNLYKFACLYNAACCCIYRIFGANAYYNTLSFE